MAQVTALSPTATPGLPYSFSAKGAAALVLTLKVKLGSVVLVSSGAVTPPSSGSNVAWKMEGLFVVRSTGASGTVMATGDHDNGQTAGLLANSAGAVTVDTTSAADLQVSAEWSAADASNTITVQNIDIEQNA